MECKRIEELLSPYLENELSHSEKQVVEEHVQTCQGCQDLLQLIKEINVSLATFPELDVSPQLHSRLVSVPEKRKKFRISLDFLVRPALQPVLAAITVFLTLLSFYAFGPNRSDINKTIERQLHLGYSAIGKLYTRAESFTNSLVGHKNSLFDSLKNKNPLRREEE